VQKYTLRLRPETSGADEAVQGGPGHAREPRASPSPSRCGRTGPAPSRRRGSGPSRAPAGLCSPARRTRKHAAALVVELPRDSRRRGWASSGANFLPPLRIACPRGLEPGHGAFADQLPLDLCPSAAKMPNTRRPAAVVVSDGPGLGRERQNDVKETMPVMSSGFRARASENEQSIPTFVSGVSPSWPWRAFL